MPLAKLRELLLNQQQPVELPSGPTISDSPKTAARGEYTDLSSEDPGDPLPEITGGTKTIRGWPTQPLPLRRGGSEHAVHVAGDLLAIAATVPFLILAIYVWTKDNDVADEYGWAKIQIYTKIAVTAFPIVFAAVMGRTNRSIATWRLERGIKLGTLEQLLRSSSVFNTISTQLLLGSFNLLAVALLIIWALSPLGGQASLHIINIKALTAISPANVTTFNTEKASFFSLTEDILIRLPTLNGVYVTSLLAPESVKVSSEDLWGNIKVPVMSRLGKANETGWYQVPHHSEVVPYSSLVGIPAFGYLQAGNTTFTMESSYFDINCYNLSLASYVLLEGNLSVAGNGDSPEVIKVPAGFMGSNGSETCGEWTCQISFSLGFDYYVKNWAFSESNLFPNVTGNEKNELSVEPTLLFQSRVWGGKHQIPQFTVAYCSVKRIYVESDVSCLGDPTGVRPAQCRVRAMRDSLVPHPASDITPFMFAGMFINFSSRLARSAGQGREYTSTLTERYLNNTASPLLTPDNSLPLFDIPKDEFSHRLSQVINTYYLASILPEGMVGNLSGIVNSAALGAHAGGSTHSVNGTTTTHPHSIYVVNGAWLAAFLIPTLAMVVAAIIGAILSHRTSIPDVLGYASSLTRESKYVPLPTGASTLNGLARSRLLRNRLVRFGDVQAGEEAGHLALADRGIATRVERSRVYD